MIIRYYITIIKFDKSTKMYIFVDSKLKLMYNVGGEVKLGGETTVNTDELNNDADTNAENSQESKFDSDLQSQTTQTVILPQDNQSGNTYHNNDSGGCASKVFKFLGFVVIMVAVAAFILYSSDESKYIDAVKYGKMTGSDKTIDTLFRDKFSSVDYEYYYDSDTDSDYVTVTGSNPNPVEVVKIQYRIINESEDRVYFNVYAVEYNGVPLNEGAALLILLGLYS